MGNENACFNLMGIFLLTEASLHFGDNGSHVTLGRSSGLILKGAMRSEFGEFLKVAHLSRRVAQESLQGPSTKKWKRRNESRGCPSR